MNKCNSFRLGQIKQHLWLLPWLPLCSPFSSLGPFLFVSTVLRICCSCSWARDTTLSFSTTSPLLLLPPCVLSSVVPLLLGVAALAVCLCLSGLPFSRDTKPRLCFQSWNLIIKEQRCCMTPTLVNFLPFPALCVRALLRPTLLDAKRAAASLVLVLVSLCRPNDRRAKRSSPCSGSTLDNCLELKILAALGRQGSWKDTT